MNVHFMFCAMPLMLSAMRPGSHALSSKNRNNPLHMYPQSAHIATKINRCAPFSPAINSKTNVAYGACLPLLAALVQWRMLLQCKRRTNEQTESMAIIVNQTGAGLSSCSALFAGSRQSLLHLICGCIRRKLLAKHSTSL